MTGWEGSRVVELVTTPVRRAVLEHVADSVLALPARGVDVLRVAVDGIDGAGKTTFSDELRQVLGPSGRPVIRATVDRFHHPRSIRYVQGKGSPEGFYRDSYDYATLRSVLLEPLSPGGSGRFRREVFDVDADTALDSPVELAPPRAILVFDGIFLHRPELRDFWDLSVFLRVDWPRNHHLRRLTPPVNVEEARFHRYQAGQELYFRECEPWTRADIVIDNDDLAAPFVVPSAATRTKPR